MSFCSQDLIDFMKKCVNGKMRYSKTVQDIHLLFFLINAYFLCFKVVLLTQKAPSLSSYVYIGLYPPLKGSHHPTNVFFFNDSNWKVIFGHKEGFGTKINNFLKKINFDHFSTKNRPISVEKIAFSRGRAFLSRRFKLHVIP